MKPPYTYNPRRSEERIVVTPRSSTAPSAAASTRHLPRTPSGATARTSSQMQNSARLPDAPPAYDDIFGNSSAAPSAGAVPSTSHEKSRPHHSSSLKEPSRKSSSRGPSPCPSPRPPVFGGPSAPPPPHSSRSLDVDHTESAPNAFTPPSVAPNWEEAEEEKELRMWFAAVDESGDGHITADELQQALLNDNFTPFNMDTISMMLRMFDKNLNDRIEFREFAGLKRYAQDWKKTFDRFDADHSGTIDVHEIKQAFDEMGHTFTPKFCSTLCQRFSPKSGARIGLDAFIYACATIKALSLDHQRNPRNMSLESFLSRWVEGAK